MLSVLKSFDAVVDADADADAVVDADVDVDAVVAGAAVYIEEAHFLRADEFAEAL